MVFRYLNSRLVEEKCFGLLLAYNRIFLNISDHLEIILFTTHSINDGSSHNITNDSGKS